MLKTLEYTVSPAFNGTATLPRIHRWEELRRSLSRSPLESEPDLGRLLASPLGARYRRSLGAFRPVSAEAVLSMEPCPEPRLRVDLRFRDAEGAEAADRWQLEVDANGMVVDLRSDSRIGDWAFSAPGFSRFLDALLAGI